MAHRFVSASVLIGATTTACSLFAPSDSEFFVPPGASGTGAAGAGGNAGTQSSAGGSMASAGGSSAQSGEGGSISGAGGRGGTTVDAAVGAGGTGMTDAGGGSSGSGNGGTLGAAGTAGRGGVAGTGGSGARGGSSGGTGARGGSAGSTDSGADSSGCMPRLVYDFESGSLAGVTSDLALEVRTFDGSQALALDIAQLNAVSYVTIRLSICATGTVDLRDKTLSFRVYFQGAPPSSSSLIVQAWLPDRPGGGAFLGGVAPSTGVWTTFSRPLRESDFSGATSTITIEGASTGVAFMGTMWLDDFRIE